MAMGNAIVVNSPHGRKLEGIVSGTPKPGTWMQIKPSVAPVGGRHTWEAAGTSGNVGDGSPRLLAILDVDQYQGKTVDDAYVSGTRCFLWCPLPGDELNVRKADISGTSSALEDLNIGEKMLIVDGTGLSSPLAVGIVASPATYPMTVLETVTDQPAETLVHVMINHH